MTIAAGGLAEPGPTDPAIDTLVPGSIKIHSTEEAVNYLLSHDFKWPVASDSPTLIVPRIVTNDLPRNWGQGLDVASRKSVFIRLLAPLILIANEQIKADRTYILDALASGHGAELCISERYKMIVTSYRLPADTAPMKVLKRVDIIPPSLAISQAILESGWGTSRFAAEGNALYGEWVWGSGMMPMQRDTSLGDYGVRSFSSLLRSALSYMRNLNTSHHYQDFRTARMELRFLDKSLDACGLATHLSAYAALNGKEYRNVLCNLMMQNNLNIIDSAVLASTPAVMLDFRVSETLSATGRMGAIKTDFPDHLKRPGANYLVNAGMTANTCCGGTGRSAAEIDNGVIKVDDFPAAFAAPTAVQIQKGDTVLGSDHMEIGTVEDVLAADDETEAHMVVPRGMIFSSDTYIPLDAVVKRAGDQVFVNVPKLVVGEMPWNDPPAAQVKKLHGPRSPSAQE